MPNFAERIANLTPEQRGLFQLRALKDGTALTRDRIIPRRQTAEPSLLSFAQGRWWLLHQLEPESPAPNKPKVFRISGPLKADVLHEALNALVARHEVLRTTIVAPDRVPRQIVGPPRPVPFPVIDLS